MSNTCGFTRASALGPIASFVDLHGGSINRVFERADMPRAILDHPNMLLPLGEQFNILQEAAREIGDGLVGASLGQHVRIRNLGAFGKWVGSAATLAGAIDRSNRGLNRFLQTGTNLRLEDRGECVRWYIEFLDPGFNGRFQNELLGISYLIDVGRAYLGRSWTPDCIRATGTHSKQSVPLEHIFATSVMTGDSVPAIEFCPSLLATRHPSLPELTSLSDENTDWGVPSATDQVEAVSAMLAIAMLEGYPRINWVASKMGLSQRKLQRTLDAQGVTFSGLLESLLKERASDYLLLTNRPITDIAFRLGYSDPAHFSRAFRRWTGTSPEKFRKRR